MRTFMYVFLRLIYFVGPFIIGTLVVKVAERFAEGRRETINLKKYVVMILFLALLIIATAIVYLERYPDESTKLSIVFILSMLAGFSSFLWWPRAKKALGESLTRFMKVLIFILLLVWIPDHLTFEIEVLSPVIFFSLLGWTIWELKLKIYPPKIFLGDEV